LALINLGIGRGDTVICSDFTFAASAYPIVYQGAEPVFIDSNSETWNMDPDLLRVTLAAMARRSALPKAVIVVDLYGQCADYDPIIEICEEYGVILIEDAAEALGAKYKNRNAGTFGAVSIYSFNGNKIITTSGGGMLSSSDEELIGRSRFLSTQARDPAPHYQHSTIGYNYRMSNVLAAIGRGQLLVLDDRIKRRREIFDRYVENLRGIPGIDFMPEPPGYFSNRWLTCVTIDPDKFGSDREIIRLELEKYNIESRPLWKPMHLQPVFESCEAAGGKVSAGLFRIGLCLPSRTAMTDLDVDEVSEIILSKKL